MEIVGDEGIALEKLLYPLGEFYRGEDRPLPPAAAVAAEEAPARAGCLLVHEDDMTPTLEAFHGDLIHLRVLKWQLDETGSYRRLVVLVLDANEKPVEFGAIVIHTQHFPPAAREEILEGRRPLGTILAHYGIEHESRPQAFFRLTSDPLMNETLGLDGPQTLYGRRNIHVAPDGTVLAEILEILPP